MLHTSFTFITIISRWAVIQTLKSGLWSGEHSQESTLIGRPPIPPHGIHLSWLAVMLGSGVKRDNTRQIECEEGNPSPCSVYGLFKLVLDLVVYRTSFEHVICIAAEQLNASSLILASCSSV
ncbi:hypothetical protein CsSME_00054296 [Camellia sinensis var. sinensis]